MEKNREMGQEEKTVVVRLAPSDYEILERFRGDLNPDAFFSVLLRLINSGAVMSKPEWVKEAETK